MKKLLFIASVGLLFSCSNGEGTCACTSTVTGSDAEAIYGANPYIYYGDTFIEKDAQEYCNQIQINADIANNTTNNESESSGQDFFISTICEVKE